MNIVFLLDPLETIKRNKDTSLLLMVSASRKGHRVFYLPKGGLTRRDGRAYFHVEEVRPDPLKEYPFIPVDKLILDEAAVDIVFIRTDPPFNEEYLFHMWILDLLPKRIIVVNNPSGIRSVNEKIWASQFTSVVPPTFIGRNRNEMYEFLEQHQTLIAKPINGFGGQAIFYMQKDAPNTHVILETLTQDWHQDIILQKYIPEAKDGDKRILLLNGEPLGALLRIHKKNEHRNNLFAGGTPYATGISPRDQVIIDKIKPSLQSMGLILVGIDIVGSYLIEINVTSPTGMQEINRLNNCQLEDHVLDFVTALVPKE